MKQLFELFVSFAKIGLFTFGGGYAMLPLIERECVEKKKWISGEEMLNVTVLADSTPGPVAVNCATFVGYRRKKLAGAVAATLGVTAPSFAVILIVALFARRRAGTPVAGAFRGIKLAVGVLIIDAAIRLFSKLPKKAMTYAIAAAACAAMLAINIFAVRLSSVVLMLFAAATGVIVYLCGRRKTEEEHHDLS